MQIIRLGETDPTLIEIPFETVSSTDHVTMLGSSDLANAAITVYIKKANVAAAVLAGAGSFTAVDDTNAKGIRGYKPAVAELVKGVSTFIFTGSGMDRRAVPVMVVPEDPYKPAYYGAVASGTLTTAAFTTDLATSNPGIFTSADQVKDALIEFLSGANAGAPKLIGSFTVSGGLITLKTGFTLPVAPSPGDKFRIVTW